MRILIIPLASKIHGEKYCLKILGQYAKVFSKYNVKPYERLITSLSEAEEVMEEASRSNVHLIILTLTGGTSRLATEIASRNPNPLLIVAHGEHNSLPSALSSYNRLRNAGKRAKILFSHSPSGIDSTLGLHLRALKIIRELSGARIALVNLSEVPEYARMLSRKFGFVIIPIPEEVLLKEVETISDDEALENLRKKLGEKAAGPNEKVLVKISKLYLALRRILEKNSCSASAIECFNFIQKHGYTPCLPVAWLLDEGIPAACEADLYSLVLLIIAQKISGKPGWMANLASLYNERILLAHCTVPTLLCNSYSLVEHFESGKPYSISGLFQATRATISRLSIDLREIYIDCADVNAPVKLDANQCRTQVFARLHKTKLSNLLDLALGNHHVIIAGDYRGLLGAIAYHLDIKRVPLE